MFTMVSSSRPEIHIKLEPRCRNVTKQDCVTKWELNSQGRRVRPKQGFVIIFCRTLEQNILPKPNTWKLALFGG